MKVLLAHAYCLALDPAEKKVMKPYPPLGLLYLSAFLKGQGYEVEVFDGTFAEPEAFGAHFRRFQPQVVGFYANMMTRHRVLRLRACISDARVKIAVGGPDPPHYADAYLDAGFHVVIIGEGEPAMAAWLAALEEPESWGDIPGLAFRMGGQTIRTQAQKTNQPINQYPLPDRDAICLDAYLDCWEKHHQMRPISLITTRGCPYRCTWCAHNVYGHSLRKRSVENVLAELEWLRSRYRFSHYWFADDVFTIAHPWLFQFRDRMVENPDLMKPFECISRADRLSQKAIGALADLNCTRVWVGAESGSQRLLDAMERGVTRDQVARAVSRLRKAGIETGMFFMWGFGDEQLEDILATVSLASKCRPDIALTTIAYPIKGTRFYRQLAERGLVRETLGFTKGTDRDFGIEGQQDPALYDVANNLLHTQLQAERLKRTSSVGWAKSLVYGAKAVVLRNRLKRMFSHPVSAPTA